MLYHFFSLEHANLLQADLRFFVFPRLVCWSRIEGYYLKFQLQCLKELFVHNDAIVDYQGCGRPLSWCQEMGIVMYRIVEIA